MRKSALVWLLAVVLVLALAAPSFAWSRGHGHGHFHGHGGGRFVVGFGFGVGPWWGPYPWGGYPYYPYYPYPYPPYAYGQPSAVMQEPPVYVQQQPAPARPAAPTPQNYWYYCPSMSAYYPSVPSCAEPWVKVPPRPE